MILPIFIEEQHSRAAADWLQSLTELPMVGHLATAEVGSAISRLRRMQKLSDSASTDVLAAIDQWFTASVAIVGHQAMDYELAASLVRHPRPKLLSPDALHLATCHRLGATLVSFDDDLIAIAKARAVPCFSPG